MTRLAALTDAHLAEGRARRDRMIIARLPEPEPEKTE